MSIEKTYKFDNKEYYHKNKSRWLNKIHCDICNLDICASSKYRHNKSVKHIAGVEREAKNGNKQVSKVLEELENSESVKQVVRKVLMKLAEKKVQDRKDLKVVE